jgi:membrane-bound inhibitor of C-type lysozyme
MTRLSIPAALALILALGVASAHADGTDPVPLPGETATYKCESGAVVVAQYDVTDPAAPTARLEYAGKVFDMFNVISASGARFSTESGLQPDHGLQWWTHGDEAVMSEMVMDHTAPGPTVIETCTLVS